MSLLPPVLAPLSEEEAEYVALLDRCWNQMSKVEQDEIDTWVWDLPLLGS